MNLLSGDVDALQAASDTLAKQDKTIKRMHNIIDNLDCNTPEDGQRRTEAVDVLSGIEEQFKNTRYKIR